MCPTPNPVTMTHLDLSWVVVALAVIALAVAIIILAKRVRQLERPIRVELHVNQSGHLVGATLDSRAHLSAEQVAELRRKLAGQ